MNNHSAFFFIALPVIALIISGDLMMSTNVKYSCSSLSKVTDKNDLLVKLASHSVNVDTLTELKKWLSPWCLEYE